MFLHLLAGALLLALLILVFLPVRLVAPVVAVFRVPWPGRLFLTIVLGFILMPFAALAQSATTVTTNDAGPVSLGPFVTIWASFVNAIVQNVIGVIITLILTALAPFVPSFLKSVDNARNRAVLTSAAQTVAGNVLAKIEGDISKMSFNIGNPLVRSMANWIISTGAPDAVKKLGVSPEDVAEKVVAEIGRLQVTAPAAVAPPA